MSKTPRQRGRHGGGQRRGARPVRHPEKTLAGLSFTGRVGLRGGQRDGARRRERPGEKQGHGAGTRRAAPEAASGSGTAHWRGPHRPGPRPHPTLAAPPHPLSCPQGRTRGAGAPGVGLGTALRSVCSEDAKTKRISQQDTVIILGRSSIFKIGAGSRLPLWSWVSGGRTTSRCTLFLKPPPALNLNLRRIRS